MEYKQIAKNTIVVIKNNAICGKKALGDCTKAEKLSATESLISCEHKNPRRWNPANVSHITGGSIINESLTPLFE